MSKNFVQHIPTFAEGVEPKVFEWETQEELVFKLSEIGYGNGVGEYFELSENLIMEVSNNGYHWWVAGRVSSVEGLTFEKWTAKEKPTVALNPDSNGYDPSKVIVIINGVKCEGFDCE